MSSCRERLHQQLQAVGEKTKQKKRDTLTSPGGCRWSRKGRVAAVNLPKTSNSALFGCQRLLGLDLFADGGSDASATSGFVFTLLAHPESHRH